MNGRDESAATLAPRFRSGDKKALARALSWVEDRDPRAGALAEALGAPASPAWVIGITGSPGVGKSSLVDQLAGAFLDAGKRVGVLAVDPSSPFTGGAVLGDRIRMNRVVTHPRAFVRSMATRGALGGLAAATPAAIRLLEGFGFEIVLVETVGVGQSEVEIVDTADTSVVVEAPGLGDSIQAIKAGILEIGDVFAVNKCDRPGASRAVLEIEAMLSLAPESKEWKAPVVQTSCTKGIGFQDLADALARHRDWLRGSGKLERARERRRLAHFWAALAARLRSGAEAHLGGAGPDGLLDQVARGALAPEAAAERVGARFEVEGPPLASAPRTTRRRTKAHA